MNIHLYCNINYSMNIHLYRNINYSMNIHLYCNTTVRRKEITYKFSSKHMDWRSTEDSLHPCGCDQDWAGVETGSTFPRHTPVWKPSLSTNPLMGRLQLAQDRGKGGTGWGLWLVSYTVIWMHSPKPWAAQRAYNVHEHYLHYYEHLYYTTCSRNIYTWNNHRLLVWML